MTSSTTDEKNTNVLEVEETTGLPWLKSWRATYTFTLASFAVWVALLWALTEWVS